MTKKITWAFTFVFIASIFVGSLRLLDDPDIWFQLLAGRYFLKHGVVPHSDFFLYAGNSSPQIFGGWAFGTFYEIVIRAIGFSGASIVNAGVWTTSLVLAILAGLQRHKDGLRSPDVEDLLMWLIAPVILFFGVSWRMGLRAECALFLAWQMLAYLDSKWIAKEDEWKFWLTLPLVLWVETIFHTGAFLLLCYVPIAIAGRWDGLIKSPKRQIILALSLLGCVLFPVLNPNGLPQFLLQPEQIFSSLFPGQSQIGDSHIDGFQISEYEPIWSPRMSGMRIQFALIALLGVLTLIFIRISKSKKESAKERIEITVFAAFFLMACLHVRGLSLAAMVIAPSACQAFSGLSVSQFSRRPRATLLIAAFVAIAPALNGMAQNSFGIEQRVNKLEQAAQEIKSLNPNGANIFAAEKGPALLYAINDERYKVSFSSHFLLENKDSVRHEFLGMGAGSGWEEDFKKRDVAFVCIPFYLTSPGAGVGYKISQILVFVDEWKLVEFTPICPLFRRLGPDEVITAQEREDKLLAYWGYMALFEHPAGALNPDVLGMKLGAQARMLLEAYVAKKNALKEHVVVGRSGPGD